MESAVESGTGTGSGATPATYSTNQTGYDICDSSYLSDVTYISHSESTSYSCGRRLVPSRRLIRDEYTTVPRAPFSVLSSASYESFPTSYALWVTFPTRWARRRGEHRVLPFAPAFDGVFRALSAASALDCIDLTGLFVSFGCLVALMNPRLSRPLCRSKSLQHPPTPVPSPIDSGPPSTTYEAPSELSSLDDMSLLSSSSHRSSLSRALSNIRSSWGRGSSAYELSILAPSLSARFIALQDAPDTSGETSFLRPTEALSSWDREPHPALGAVNYHVAAVAASAALAQSLGHLVAVELPERDFVVVGEDTLGSHNFLVLVGRVGVPCVSRAGGRTSFSFVDHTPSQSPAVLGSALDAQSSDSGSVGQPIGLHALRERAVWEGSIAGIVRALRNELRDLADSLHHPASRAPSSSCGSQPSPMPHAPLPLPVTEAPALHHSDDDLWEPLPIRDTAEGLWQSQIWTNQSLDWLREHRVPRDTELHDRMARIEDLSQSIIDQPREAPHIAMPLPTPAPAPDLSDSDADFSWATQSPLPGALGYPGGADAATEPGGSHIPAATR
ncbi:hypothetical protein C8R47DRAFT_1248860 [Mycena vitilis]|nr:hypothetical protein C8R47DRAFT_1248860 [Mycena vitilis]